ncbi:T6SS effector amidase Tae4 family protein [Flavobacterium amniphilum]|uniref:T6SS effector amidase Tae4 family protein n=1 Tax=Flavobacterium amniphilum TaxID=1834035 RepID=UPI00202A4025|nr:T6SS effector amidase Tae4 family protein [Flavobacterium amniphilum]MCL9806898.1 T6SS effector amidase Tae4 family protein [Flavobacterium amniphilum]
MKKIYILLIALLPLLTYGQTPTENYLYQTTYTKAVQDGFQGSLSSDYKLQQVTYYDKMGRPMQNIAVEAGENKQSIVSHYEYDNYTGAQTKSYLPYAATLTSPLNYNSTAVNNIAPYYQSKYSQDFPNGVNPYSETVFEKSPIGNVLKQGAPGSDWKVGFDDTDHTVKMEYKSNIDNDVYAFDVVFTGGDFMKPTISYLGYYKRNELYLTITKNENWKAADGKLNTTETYKDKEGKTILVRTFDSIGGVATPHNLYNIYDDYGNLTFVLSPKATDGLVVTPTATYTNFSQNIPYSSLVTSPFVPTATAATISQTGINQLSLAFNFTTSKGRTLKPGIIATLTTTVPDCLLGYITNGSYNFEVAIKNNQLIITDIAMIAMPIGTPVTMALTVMLPTPSTLAPLATTLLPDLCYEYHYDAKNRAVEKKIPGKALEIFVYDNLNRPILSQDANLKANNKWLFVKYDNYGRVAYTGVHTDNINTTRAAIQQIRDNATTPVLFESKIPTPVAMNGTNLHYSNAVFPDTNIELLSVNYYDDYNFDKDGIAVPTAPVYSQPVTTITKGLTTGSKVRTLDTTNWATTVVAYDAKARAIWTSGKDNYLQTSDVLEAKLDDFTGTLIETKTVHNKALVTTNLTTYDYFTYDHRLRLLKHTQKIGSNSLEVIASNKYDDLGQLIQKKVGGADAATHALTAGLQTVDYSFNVRGWLTKINDANAMGSDLFAFEIKYNKPTAAATALYNGNISQTLWRTANSDTGLKQYNYTYDNLDRLKQAQFSSTVGATTTSNTHNESLNYDKNGNITILQRSGYTNANVFDQWLDNLTYTYQGNQLVKVDDAGNKTEGFKDVTATTDYTYDNNGNLITDINKAITSISYNYLNQPLKITFSGTNKFIEFVYNAGGTKLSKKITNGSTIATTYYAGNYIYEQTGSSPVLRSFSQPEGYVDVNAGTYKYVYQYKDHLGNVRLNYTKNGSVLEIVEENHYYPFGVKHKGYNNVVTSLGNGTANKFKFNGKESEVFEGLNVTEMDFRQYDAALGRFNCIDLLAESTPMATPYHFALNNPVIANDPSGLLSSSTWNDLIDYMNTFATTEGNQSLSYTSSTSGAGGGGWGFNVTYSDGNGNSMNLGEIFGNGSSVGGFVRDNGHWVTTTTTSYGTEKTAKWNGGNALNHLNTVVISQTKSKTWVSDKSMGLQVFPSFSTLWNNYPKDVNGSHAHPSKDPYPNQCAIRVGYTYMKSGIKMNSYPKVNRTSEGYPRSSKGLADWTWQNFGKPKIMSQEAFERDYMDSTGIIYIVPPPGGIGHIDLFNAGATGSGYYLGSEIWFWPIK